ncbi:MAG: NUDIX hydrolase [Caldilineaceae bacterium]
MTTSPTDGVVTKIPTEQQISAGGVVVRQRTGQAAEIVLIAVGPQGRWQLPKGMIESGETPEQAAIREVREETGIEGRLIAPLDVVEYWYVSTHRGMRVRYHKFVHCFLFDYVSGDVTQHDQEVSEARWVSFAEAMQMLKFVSERQVVAQARTLIEMSEARSTNDRPPHAVSAAQT